MTVIDTYKDGRFLSRQVLGNVVSTGQQPFNAAGNLAVNTTFAEMRVVEYIIKLETRQQQATLVNVVIVGTPALVKNVAGITLGASASATVTGEMIASGY